MNRILVCGSRHTENNAQNRDFVFEQLDRFCFNREWIISSEDGNWLPHVVLIHGASPVGGIDWIADDWATTNWLQVERFPPLRDEIHLWGFATACKIRNQRMIDEAKPNVVIGFAGGNGTADMKARARVFDVEVIEI